MRFRVAGSGQSYDGLLYYKRGRPMPWYAEVPTMLLGYGAGFGVPLAGMLLIVFALMHWPIATTAALVVSYFSVAFWVRWKWA